MEEDLRAARAAEAEARAEAERGAAAAKAARSRAIGMKWLVITLERSMAKGNLSLAKSREQAMAEAAAESKDGGDKWMGLVRAAEAEAKAAKAAEAEAKRQLKVAQRIREALEGEVKKWREEAVVRQQLVGPAARRMPGQHSGPILPHPRGTQSEGGSSPLPAHWQYNSTGMPVVTVASEKQSQDNSSVLMASVPPLPQLKTREKSRWGRFLREKGATDGGGPTRSRGNLLGRFMPRSANSTPRASAAPTVSL